jgi:hypothetical protein
MSCLPSRHPLSPGWPLEARGGVVVPPAYPAAAGAGITSGGLRLDAAALEEALQQLRRLQSLVAQGPDPCKR